MPLPRNPEVASPAAADRPPTANAAATTIACLNKVPTSTCSSVAPNHQHDRDTEVAFRRIDAPVAYGSCRVPSGVAARLAALAAPQDSLSIWRLTLSMADCISLMFA